jgi:hypothetical protein
MSRTASWIALLVLCAGAVAGADDQPRPAWLGKEPLIIVGNWDSMPIFRRRVGATSLDKEEQYARQHTEEAAVSSKTKSMPIGIHCFRLPVCANTICPSSPL